MSSKDTYERISIDIVAAARETFAKGRRTEAIEMLRRFDLGRRGEAAIGEALQELMLEQQRLIEEERNHVREAVAGHLSAAKALLASGMLPEAWARACDALHFDPNDQGAIALEARIRRALDVQAGRNTSPEKPKSSGDREPEASRVARGVHTSDSVPAVSAESPAMTSQPGWWIVAVAKDPPDARHATVAHRPDLED